MNTPLPAAAQRVQVALVALDISTRVVEFPQGTRTAADAAQAIGCTVAQIAKSIIFRGAASGKGILVITSGANPTTPDYQTAIASFDGAIVLVIGRDGIFGLSNGDAALTVVTVERHQYAAGRVGRIGCDQSNAGVHAGAQQGGGQRCVRRVKYDPADVLERQAHLAVILRNDDLPISQI